MRSSAVRGNFTSGRRPLGSSSSVLKVPNSGYDDDANNNDDEDDDDNEDSGGSVSDAVNEGNHDVNSEEVQVTFCVLPNLVEHAGHGKDDIFIIDSFNPFPFE